MEAQKTLNRQSSLEKEKWSWRNQPSWLQNILQNYSHQDSMILAPKQKYRPMEQDRKPRNKEARIYSGVKTASSIKGAGKIGQLHVQFSRSVMSNSLWPHESQHARRPCPTPTPRVHSNSYPLSQWCHPAISSSVIPFSSCPQSLPASGSFPMSQPVLHIRWPKYWSLSFSISPSSEHPGLISFRMDWLDFLAVQGTLKSLLQHHGSKASILRCSM